MVFAAGKASIRECVPRSSPLTQGANFDAPLRTQIGGVTHHEDDEKSWEAIMRRGRTKSASEE
jgi:hypothetical protein